MDRIARSSIRVLALALSCALAGAVSARGPAERGAEDLPGPLVGAIEITNERDRAVRIFIDGRFAIELRPRTTDRIERVPNGVRLVSYRGAGEAWQTDRVEVREGRRAALRIAPQRGQLAIFNRAEVEMQVALGDVELGVVRPGRELLTPPLAPGSYSLRASPRHRHAPQLQEVRVVAGEVARVEIWLPRERFGDIEVRNPSAHAVRITLGGEAGFRLPPGAVRVIRDLPAGPLTIQLTTDDGRMVRHQTRITPGEIQHFQVPLAWVSKDR